MKRKILVLIGLVFLLTNISYSQEGKDIAIDRLGQTRSPLTVSKGFIQAELGGGYWEKSTVTNLYTLSEKYERTDCMMLINNPSFSIRYGLLKNVELRLAVSYNQEIHQYSYDKFTLLFYDRYHTYAWSPLQAGAKIKFFEGKGIIPMTAFIFNLAIPTGDYYLHTDFVSPDIKFVLSSRLSEKFRLNYNIGYGWQFYEHFTYRTGTYAVSLVASLTKRITAFAETYAYLTDGRKPDHRAGAGFTYLFAKNVMADFSGGIGITSVSPDFSLGMGISLRLPE